jgi:flagellar biosynthesis protein FliR
MIGFTDAELSGFLAGFLWPLARIAAFIAAAPVFGNLGVPARVKVLLAVGVTLAILPGAGAAAGIAPWSAAGLAVLVQQMLIGAAMGLAMRVVFTMVDVAGEMIGLQMGLSFAVFFDPQHGAHTAVVGQFLGLLATLTFLAVDGHHALLGALAESFTLLPIGAGAGAATWIPLAEWGGSIFSTGLTIALPVIAALLITNIALGILTRAAPQLNLFAIGFPVTILVGWTVLWLSLPMVEPVLMQAFDDGLRVMLRTLGPR